MNEIRILVDENTSPQVSTRLQEAGYTATHVTDALDAGATDQEIIAYAADHEYAVLTHDDDFLRSNHAGIPILYYSDDTLATHTLVERVATLIEYAPSADDLPQASYLDSWE